MGKHIERILGSCKMTQIMKRTAPNADKKRIRHKKESPNFYTITINGVSLFCALFFFLGQNLPMPNEWKLGIALMFALSAIDIEEVNDHEEI